MFLTYFGHSCFSVTIQGSRILFDPYISGNPLASHISLEDINADYILISHGHTDHVADVEAIARRTGAIILSNFEIVNWFASKGLKHNHPMNIGGQVNFEFGGVHYVNAVHSSTMPDGSTGGNPGGFVIRSDEGSFYFAGDTALHMDMQLIGERHQLDYCVLPIGDNFTMGVDDAIRSCDFIRCNTVIGVHYNTFPLIKIDEREAIRKFTEAGKRLLLPAIGETIEI
jgi:L-ascorbate metabolism protein UlaG (beta-lactamase superfamily)